MENQRLLGPQQFCEQGPDVDAPVIRTALVRRESRGETEEEMKECKQKVRQSASDENRQLLPPCCCPSGRGSRWSTAC